MSRSDFNHAWLRVSVAAGLLAVLAGCGGEHIQEPWVNESQQALVQGELSIDDQTRHALRDRGLAIQQQR
ncbi:MAG: hypothetical protein RQ729_00200 [Wenzhouxiangellaceae bacterium]|nr:hypothetical protein [Wenzhouxiangellaceae bacterium]